MNVEFELRLRDMMSGVLPKVAATARDVFGSVDKKIKETQGYLDLLGRGSKINVDTSGLDAAHGKMKDVMSTWEIMKGTMLGGLAIQGIERGIGAAKEFLTDSLHRGMEEEKTQMRLKVMKGDAQGMELYEQTHQNLLHSMYGTQLYGGAVSLTASGLNSEQVNKKLLQFEDLASGDAGSMEQLIATYQRVKGTGHVNYHEMLPLLTMGFDPIQTLMGAHGGKATDWHAKLEDPTQGLKLFDEAIRLATDAGGKFHDLQKRLIEQTGYGKYTLAMTNWENTKAEFGEKMLPAMTHVLDKISPLMDKLPAQLDKLIPAIETLGQKAVNWIEWGATHTQEIKKLISVTIDLTKAYLLMNGLGVIGKTVKGFKAGLAGTELIAGVAGGAEAAGGVGIARYAGMGAGLLEQAVGTSLAVIGGVGALVSLSALVAYSQWEEHNKDNAEHTYKDMGWVPDPKVIGKYDPAPKMYGKNGLVDDPFVIYMPNEKPISKPQKKKKEEQDTSAASDASDAIVGGGRKQIIINVKSFAEHFIVHAGNLKDAAAQSKETFERMFLEVLQSANAAM